MPFMATQVWYPCSVVEYVSEEPSTPTEDWRCRNDSRRLPDFSLQQVTNVFFQSWGAIHFQLINKYLKFLTKMI